MRVAKRWMEVRETEQGKVIRRTAVGVVYKRGSKANEGGPGRRKETQFGAKEEGRPPRQRDRIRARRERRGQYDTEAVEPE